MNEKHEHKSGRRGDQARKEGQAVGGFGAGEHAGPHHVGGEAGDANDAGGEADPVAIVCAAPGMDGDDDSGNPATIAMAFFQGKPSRRKMAESSEIAMGAMKTRM